MNGEVVHLDVYKGAGIMKSEITHAAAAVAGLPQCHAYRVQVKGIREDSGFRAKGVDIIRRTSVRKSGCGELPFGQRPDVLLGMEDAKRLEGYLRAGWCKDPVTQGGLSKRDRTSFACTEEKLSSSETGTAVGGLSGQIREQPHLVARSWGLGHTRMTQPWGRKERLSRTSPKQNAQT